MQVVPRRVVAEEPELAEPVLGLQLDSEAVLRQIQRERRGGAAESPVPHVPGAAVHVLLPVEPVQSERDALPSLVGDLFGEQAMAVLCNSSGDASSPHEHTGSTGATGWQARHLAADPPPFGQTPLLGQTARSSGDHGPRKQQGPGASPGLIYAPLTEDVDMDL